MLGRNSEVINAQLGSALSMSDYSAIYAQLTEKCELCMEQQ